MVIVQSQYKGTWGNPGNTSGCLWVCSSTTPPSSTYSINCWGFYIFFIFFNFFIFFYVFLYFLYFIFCEFAAPQLQPPALIPSIAGDQSCFKPLLEDELEIIEWRWCQNRLEHPVTWWEESHIIYNAGPQLTCCYFCTGAHWAVFRLKAGWHLSSIFFPKSYWFQYWKRS